MDRAPAPCCRLVLLVAALQCSCTLHNGDPGGTATDWGGLGILAGADERIQKYRKAFAVINVVAEGGTPAADATIEIEQDSHEFLFGANNSLLMQYMIASSKHAWRPPDRVAQQGADITVRDVDSYLQKLAALANYTTLPVWWNLYENEKGVIDEDLYKKEISRLHGQGLKVLAHSLVWNNMTPDWVSDDCDELGKALDTRVSHFMSEYRDAFDYFLVVNEGANPFRPIFEDDKMTRCIKLMGTHAFASRVFTTARAAAPDAKLMINEVSILKHQGFPALLRGLTDPRQRPLYDIIGIQSHMHEHLWSLDDVWKVCEGYAAFGAPIHFSEVTVLSGSPISGMKYGRTTTKEGERLQAEYAVRLYTVLFSHPAVQGIMWWNLSDFGAWRDAPAGLLRSDMGPKPAYSALVDLVRRKWWTRAQTKTSRNGRAGFTGFFGIYHVTVTPKQGRPKVFDIRLSKDGVREFTLAL
ncbi:MAG: endo-1,4-beta-xylanase [Acidobacteria bacterium]|nr:endo-1,4-beta-xylanase [Acidobacteriota bacterium]